MYAFMYFANFVQPNICHFSQDPEVGMVVKAKQAAAIDQPINDQQQDSTEAEVKLQNEMLRYVFKNIILKVKVASDNVTSEQPTTSTGTTQRRTTR